MSKESINECIENIIKKDFSKAKLVIAENFRNSSNKRNIGTKFALEGIISKYAVKNIDISESLEDFKSMKKGIMNIEGDVGAKKILLLNKDKILDIKTNDQSIMKNYNSQHDFSL